MSRVIDRWRRTRLTRPKINRAVFYESRADVPNEVPRHVLAIVGSAAQPKWALFECPCGRSHQLVVNLNTNRKPYWRLKMESDGPSLWPSVDSVSPYRCHFWLRGGRVDWHYGD
jgi:hypothetical protein